MTPRKRIVEQIKNANIFNEVAGAASIAAALENNNVLPGCYVIESNERAGENTFLNGVHQQSEIAFSILIIIENITDDFGEDSSDQLRNLRQDLKAVLLGFKAIENEETMLEYKQGGLIAFQDDQLQWLETYIIKDVSTSEI